MKTIAQRFILSVSFAAALLLAGCHLNEEKTAEEVPDAAPISYEYLYDCLWTVADLAENADGLPEMLADPNGAVFFQKAGHTMSVFRKRNDTDENTSLKTAYALESQRTYSVDTESGIISVSGKGMECYFRIERLNDRAMTLCYRSDRNEYVAFSRCLLSSVTFVE